MSNSWENRRKALEEKYFEEAERETLAKLAKSRHEGERKSPITGEPMEQVTLFGVVIDRCKKSGGIWLDAGELEQLLEMAKGSGTGERKNWFSDFFELLSGGNK